MDLAVGLSVKILPYSEYRGRYEGKIGTIEQYSDEWDTVGIKIDDCYNIRSKNGYFWFSKDKIKVLESENYDMNSEKFLVAGIKFQDGTNTDKEYFYALYDESIGVDDLVVVKTGHHGLALAKVSSIGKYEANVVQCGREIVTKVDMSAYEERVNKRESIKKLKMEMDKKVKELQAVAIYELLAKEDETLATLLKEYKSLIG